MTVFNIYMLVVEAEAIGIVVYNTYAMLNNNSELGLPS